MEAQILTKDRYQYVEAGNGPPLVLLHGLFGALSNWAPVFDALKDRYRVIIPLTPIYQGDMSIKPEVYAFADYISGFLDVMQLHDVRLVGNSLGGHIALCVALLDAPRPRGRLHSLTLTGSSGLFETGMGGTYPRRGDKIYIRERVEFTFYDPKTATEDLIDEVFGIVNNNATAVRVIKIARDAQKLNMRDKLRLINVPTCLIWGLNDNITPVYVAHEFHRLIPRAELYFIDRCGHAAMMERPERFNRLLSQFLLKYESKQT